MKKLKIATAFTLLLTLSLTFNRCGADKSTAEKIILLIINALIQQEAEKTAGFLEIKCTAATGIGYTFTLATGPDSGISPLVAFKPFICTGVGTVYSGSFPAGTYYYQIYTTPPGPQPISTPVTITKGVTQTLII